MPRSENMLSTSPACPRCIRHTSKDLEWVNFEIDCKVFPPRKAVRLAASKWTYWLIQACRSCESFSPLYPLCNVRPTCATASFQLHLCESGILPDSANSLRASRSSTTSSAKPIGTTAKFCQQKYHECRHLLCILLVTLDANPACSVLGPAA